MTLAQTIRIIERVAGSQPAVHTVVRNDVYRLNELADARYGVFAWTQGQHSASADGSLQYFRFTFFYVDRLTEDKGNETEIQSVGIDVLRNVVLSLYKREIWASGDVNFTTFNQRFVDECAGVFCSVALEVPADMVCPDDFTPSPEPAGDYNDDYNDDFLIY